MLVNMPPHRWLLNTYHLLIHNLLIHTNTSLP